MRVKVRGTLYDSVRECAAALGISPKTVYWAINYGDPDKLGTGRSRPTKPRSPRFDASKPQRVADIWFPSISAVARFIGKDITHTRNAIRKGGVAYRNLEDRVRNAQNNLQRHA